MFGAAAPEHVEEGSSAAVPSSDDPMVGATGVSCRRKVLERESELKKIIELLRTSLTSVIGESDALTGARNRLCFDSYIAACMERHTISRTPVSIMMCDLDNSKKINDTHGPPLLPRVSRVRDCISLSGRGYNPGLRGRRRSQWGSSWWADVTTPPCGQPSRRYGARTRLLGRVPRRCC